MAVFMKFNVNLIYTLSDPAGEKKNNIPFFIHPIGAS